MKAYEISNNVYIHAVASLGFSNWGALHSMEDSRGGTRKNKRQKIGTTL